MEKTQLSDRLHELKRDVKVTEIAIRILELLENPTESNTSEEIFLAESPHSGKIQIGLYSNLVINRPFDTRVMEEVVKMFDNEDDYTAEYHFRTFSYGYPFIKISKNVAP